MNRLPWQGCLIVGLLLTVLIPNLSLSQEMPPIKAARPASGPVEYPLGLVAFASMDRLLGRADSLSESLGEPGMGSQLLQSVLGDDEGIAKLMQSPGLDTTRPFGAMFYPNWLKGKSDPEANSETGDAPQIGIGTDNEFLADPLSFLVESAVSTFVENATFVLCLPVKDRQQLLGVVHEIVADGKAVLEVEGQPGWYRFDEEKEIRIGFVGGYLLLVSDDDESKQFYRNYPEFDKLAKGSLGKNGFVYALYRRGLPMLVRDVMAPAFKLAFAAQFQRQDEESESDFRMRTMFGALQMELLDLALSHVDEFRISGHVDSATGTIIVEPELVGPKEGKLAKYCNSWKLKGSPFANLPSDDASLATMVSLPLPQKQWQPVVDALNVRASVIGRPEAAEFLRLLAKTVGSGQLDVHTYHRHWEQGMVALRVNGGTKFPEQFGQVLSSLGEKDDFQFDVDSVEGIAIHRSAGTLSLDRLFAKLLMSPGVDGIPAAVQKRVRIQQDVELIENELNVLIENDGKQPPAAAQSDTGRFVWLAATPQAIWLAYSSDTEGCPEWFKSRIAHSLAKPVASSRIQGPVQVVLRGLGATPANEVQLIGAVEAGDAAQQQSDEKEKARGDLLRDLPNAIQFEVTPTVTGAKLSIRFEEAYFHWFAVYVKDSAEETKNAARGPVENVQPPEPVPPPLKP